MSKSNFWCLFYTLITLAGFRFPWAVVRRCFRGEFDRDPGVGRAAHSAAPVTEAWAPIGPKSRTANQTRTWEFAEENIIGKLLYCKKT